MLNLDEKNFEEEVLKSKKLVLVDFWAPWCPPCQAMTPILEELDKELGDKIKIAKINVDDNPHLAQTYNIESIPALFIFKEGAVIKKLIGLQEKEALVNAIKKILNP